MMYWNPTTSTINEWTPIGGWNSAFSEEDKLKCTNLFFFFKSKKGFSERTANTLAQMAIYKQKYTGMRYSDEQEYQLHEALKPIFNT